MLRLIIPREMIAWIDSRKGDESRPTFIIKTLRRVMMNEGINEPKTQNRKAD